MVYLFIIILACCNNVAGQMQHLEVAVFSPEDLKSDLFYYKEKLEFYHPGLYQYTSKQDVDRSFDSLSQLIDRPLTELEFYRVICLSSSVIKDGHTLILPSLACTEFHNANSHFLPEGK